MAAKYYKVPGMMHPCWGIYQGGQYEYAHNLDADTDMGDLAIEEFHTHFPNAIEITEQEAINET